MLSLPLAALSWLGRQGPVALIFVLLIAFLLPPVGNLLRPFVTEAVFLSLIMAFMRIDPARLKATLARPGTAILIVGWTMIALPLITYAVLHFTGVQAAAPAIFLALMIQTITMPIMAAPSMVMMVGLDGTLSLVAIVFGGAMMPILTPSLIALLDLPLAISPWALAQKLALTLAGSAAAGLAMRRLVGAARIARNRSAMDGLNVLVMFIFVSSVFGDILFTAIAEPGRILGLTALAFVTNFGLLFAAWILLRPMGPEAAPSLAIVGSQRNMGLMLAVAGASLPDTVWLYVAMGQIPILLVPLALKLGARRLA
ncbi:hypothetical protein [Acuticoccus yangtzensis]|uniref:hypothetical protein n=1 Tax=Acuticoccus yangtzensis TaxID=1443441 RepID=UPI0009498569|nr:hypothetical protein [Acuticoccus yangtzensis]